MLSLEKKENKNVFLNVKKILINTIEQGKE